MGRFFWPITVVFFLGVFGFIFTYPGHEKKTFVYHDKMVTGTVYRGDVSTIDFMLDGMYTLVECKGGLVQIGVSPPRSMWRRAHTVTYQTAPESERQLWLTTFGSARKCGVSSFATMVPTSSHTPS